MTLSTQHHPHFHVLDLPSLSFERLKLESSNFYTSLGEKLSKMGVVSVT